MSMRMRRPLAALVGALSLAAGAATVAVAPARAVPPPADAQCPPTYTDPLVAGQAVDGLTVSSGNTPETFTGTVLGTISDGIAPGLDMIVVRLSSPEIDRVGIWQGMSGSPVYAADGRLIGAVSYGLAFGPSPVAGVTPADDMKALLSLSPTPQPQPAQRVPVPPSLRTGMVASGAATAPAASSGLERLALPVGVSGLSSARLQKVSSKLDLGDVRLYRSAPAAAAPLAGGAAEIFAGSNLAASLSYGDLSAVGTGTTTMVCDGKVVGFGHPFNFTGDTSMTLHGANAIYVQEDPLGAGFKVSNPTGPVGVIDEDRMAGIKGALGDAPASTLVRTSVTGPHDAHRVGNTRVSVPEFAATATALGLLSNSDRVFDHVGKGSSWVRYTITGHTAAGTPFEVVHANRYASSGDVTYGSIFEPATAVDALLENDFTGVTLDQVRLDASLSDRVRAYRVDRVQVRVGDVWRTVGPRSVVRIRPGRRVNLRVVLGSRRNEFGSTVVTTRLRVPMTAMPGEMGMVQVGSYDDFDEEGFAFGFAGDSGSAPKSFADVLRTLETAPRNDELPVSLQLMSDEDESASVETRTHVGTVVTGNTRFMLRIR